MSEESPKVGNSAGKEGFRDWITIPMPWWYMVCVVPLMRLAVNPLRKRPWITPNRITIVSFGLAASATALMYLNRPWAFIGAGLLVHFSYVLDCTDGMVARMHKMSSPWGAFLDMLLDRWKIVFYSLALIWVALTHYQDILVALLVAFNMGLAGINVFLSFAMPELIGAKRWSDRVGSESEAEAGFPAGWMKWADKKGIRPIMGDIEADMSAYCLGPIFCGVYGWTALSVFVIISILIHLVPLQGGHIYFARRYLRGCGPS